MTDNEIIKAMESEIHLAEHVDSLSVDNVSLELFKNALDLINHQRAEIERLQVADVELVRHGHWEPYKYLWGWVCSKCNGHVFCDRKSDLDDIKYPYCPHCGAKMDGKDGDNNARN